MVTKQLSNLLALVLNSLTIATYLPPFPSRMSFTTILESHAITILEMERSSDDDKASRHARICNVAVSVVPCRTIEEDPKNLLLWVFSFFRGWFCGWSHKHGDGFPQNKTKKHGNGALQCSFFLSKLLCLILIFQRLFYVSLRVPSMQTKMSRVLSGCFDSKD